MAQSTVLAPHLSSSVERMILRVQHHVRNKGHDEMWRVVRQIAGRDENVQIV